MPKRLKTTTAHEKQLWKSVAFSKVAGHTKNDTLTQLLFTHFEVIVKTFCVELELVNVHWEVVSLKNTFLKSYLRNTLFVGILSNRCIKISL